MNMDWSQRVAAAIRAEMAWGQRKETDLGAHLDMDLPALRARLIGDVPFDMAQLDVVAQFLGLSVSDLIAEATRVRATA